MHSSIPAPTRLLAVLLAGLALLAGTSAHAQSARYTRLHLFGAFSDSNTDGARPGPLALGPDGNYYGVTEDGGLTIRNAGLFRLTPAGVHTRLYTFDAPTAWQQQYGVAPRAPLAVGPDGNLYGTLNQAGANDTGLIFRATLAGEVTVLHTFGPMTDWRTYKNVGGAWPGPLVTGPDGNLYGGTRSGGPNGTGVLFRITTGGVFSVVHSFGTMPAPDEIGHGLNADGEGPGRLMTVGQDGNLYGVTVEGGQKAGGTAFRLTTAGVLTVLCHFRATARQDVEILEGQNPMMIVRRPDGDFYVAMFEKGKGKRGTIVRMTPAGALSVVYFFPATGLNGAYPWGLVPAPDGNFYGTTNSGGTNNSGSVFRITPGGALTPVYYFPPWSEAPDQQFGLSPQSPLTLTPEASFYGATKSGSDGTSGHATLFRLELPMITALSPQPVKAGSPPFTLTVDGLNFQNGAVVSWGTTNLATTFVSPTQLTAQVTSAQLTKPGVFRVKVTNPDGTSNTADYTVINGVPILTSVTPATANAGSPDTTITLGGKLFVPGAKVRWNGTDLATTYFSPSKLTAVVPATSLASPTTAQITVFNPAPGGGLSNAKPLKVVLTTLAIGGVTLERDPSTQVVTAHITLSNTGYQTAAAAKITAAKIRSPGTTTPLPVSLGDIAPGGSVVAHLTFPGTVGAAGTLQTLNVAGTFTGGAFTATAKVTLP